MDNRTDLSQNNQHQLELVDAIVSKGRETIQAKSETKGVDVIALQTQIFFCECLGVSDKLPSNIRPIASVLRHTMSKQIADAEEGLTQVAAHAMMLGVPREKVIEHIYIMFAQVFLKHFPNSNLWPLGKE